MPEYAGALETPRARRALSVTYHVGQSTSCETKSIPKLGHVFPFPSAPRGGMSRRLFVTHVWLVQSPATFIPLASRKFTAAELANWTSAMRTWRAPGPTSKRATMFSMKVMAFAKSTFLILCGDTIGWRGGVSGRASASCTTSRTGASTPPRAVRIKACSAAVQADDSPSTSRRGKRGQVHRCTMATALRPARRRARGRRRAGDPSQPGKIVSPKSRQLHSSNRHLDISSTKVFFFVRY